MNTPLPSAQVPRWTWAALAVLAAGTFVVVMYAGRDTSPFYDEWSWLIGRRDFGIETLLAAHNGHLSVVPVLINKVLLSLGGVEHYWLQRAVLALLHVGVGLAVFRFASVRIGGPAALIPTALILGLSGGAADFLWAFQIGFLCSILFGITGLVALASPRRRSGVVALVALLLALGSSGIGVVFLAAAIVWAIFDRQQQKVIAVAIPAVLYAIWFVVYSSGEEQQSRRSNLIDAPDYMVKMAAAGFGGLSGLGVEVGLVLLVIAICAVATALSRSARFTPLLAALLAAPLALWALTALSRAHLGEPGAPRYVYPSAVLIVLAGLELLRRTRPTPRVLLVLGAVTVFFLAAGVGELRTESRSLRANAAMVRAQVTAFELLKDPQVPADFLPAGALAPQLRAADLPGITRAYGPLASDANAELTGTTEVAQLGADATLLQAGAVKSTPTKAVPPVNRAGTVSLYTPSAGVLPSKAGCASAQADGGSLSEIALPPGARVLVTARDPAALAFRRFADGYGSVGQRPLPAQPLVIAAAPERTSVSAPWRVQVTGGGQVKVCAL